ncbi:MAG: hypothetical protein ABIO35_08315 [Nitrobacter sp.]
MPIIPDGPISAPRVGFGQEPRVEDTGSVPLAAFRQGNIVVSALQAVRNSGPFTPVDGYGALEDIKDSTYFDNHASRFYGSRSPNETSSIKRQIDQEENDHRTLAASGGYGIVASIAAGTFDPTIALPGRVALGVAKGGRGVIRGGLEVGAAMGLQSAAQETVLQATQETRTPGESILNIGSATLLGALLGGAVSFLSPAEHASMVKSLDRERADIEAHANTPEPLPETPPPPVSSAPPLIPDPQASVGGFRDTRGKGKNYHGSPSPLSEFDESHYGSSVNYYGARGFYTTDALDVANGYARRKGAKTPTLYEVAESKPTKIFSMEDQIHPELRAEIEKLSEGTGDTQEMARIGLEDNPKNLREFFDNVREQAASDRVPADEIQEGVFHPLMDYLEAQGFHGMSHKGGLRTKTPEHNVTIYFNPKDSLSVRELSSGEVEAQRPASKESGRGFATSAGAAASDTRVLEPVSAFGLEKVGFDPTLRTLSQPSIAARRGYADIAELSILTKDNVAGFPSTSGGAPLETIYRTQNNAMQVQLRDELKNLWGDLRLNGEKMPSAPILRDKLGMLGGEGPTFEQFKTMVSDAMMAGDKHEIPQVQAAAQQVRKMLEPWVERAEKALPEFKRETPKASEGHFWHHWNKTVIEQKRPEFVNKLTEKYFGDQTAKRSAQTRVQAYHNSLGVAEDTARKYSLQIETKTAALEELKSKAEETTRMNKAAYQRSETLRGQDGDRIENARGGAIFETKARDRGNTLGDQISAKQAEIDELERKLTIEHTNAESMRAKIEDEIGKWDGKSTVEAKSALKAREKYAAEREAKAAEKGEAKPTKRLTGADDAIDKAVKRIIESDRGLSVEEIRSKANDTVDRILGSPDGRLPYDEVQGKPQIGPGSSGEAMRGSLGNRMLDVSNDFAREWVERDIEQVVKTFNHTFMPDVLLAERFGDIEMSDVFAKINDEYAALVDASKNQKDRTKLEKQRQQAIEDVAAIRDRLRGTYAIPATASQRRIGRISAAVRNGMIPLNLGSAAITSIPDAAGTVFQWGLASAFKDGWTPFVKSLMTNHEYSKEALREAKVAGIAIDTLTAQRHHEFAGIVDTARPGSPVERALQFGADKFGMLNLLGPWTDMVKTISFTVNATNLHRALKAAVEGKATKKQTMELGAANIPPTMYDKILTQYEASGTKVDGVLLPNTESWPRETREIFEGALAKNANINVVTPGLDKPLFMSDPTWAVLTQFKSFTAAATTRILISNLQRSDAQTMQGLVASLAMGMVSYKLGAITGGTPTSDRPADWIKEAMSKGSLYGWLEEGNALASKMTRGSVDLYRLVGSDKPMSRYAGRSVMDQLLGPTFGKIQSLAQVTGSAAAGDWKESDTKAVRRMIAGQNLFYLRGMFNQIEFGANNAFGIDMKARPH